MHLDRSGFLNEMNGDDLKRLSGLGYNAGQSVGRSGVERAWESYLRGKDGELRGVYVDAAAGGAGRYSSSR